MTRTYHRVTRLSDQMGKAVQVNLVKGLKKFRSRISPEEMLEAWKTGSYAHLMATIPWEHLSGDLAEHDDLLTDAAAHAGAFTIKALPKPIHNKLRWDVSNPKLKRYISDHTGELIVGIQRDTQKIVQQAITRSFRQALDPRRVANQIKETIGLDPRREQALQSYSDSLLYKGFPENYQQRMRSQYAERLLDSRAMTIGRTETRFATNQGQLSVWREAADQDLIDRKTTRKVWIVDGNPCDTCEPMDGISVPLDEFWTLNNGDVVEIPTDSHPNCMCGMELEFGDASDEEE